MSPAGDLAQQLLACVEQAYTTSSNATPGQICLRVGEVPFSIGLSEDLCCTGLAWVRITRIFASSNFPVADQAALVCPTTQWAVELEMGAIRCLPDHGAASGATCEEWTAAFLAVDEDAAVMRRALCCMQETALGQPPVSDLFLAGEWTPIEPQGGCIGGTMTVIYGYDCAEC